MSLLVCRQADRKADIIQYTFSFIYLFIFLIFKAENVSEPLSHFRPHNSGAPMISLASNDLHLKAKGCERGWCPCIIFFFLFLNAWTLRSYSKKQPGSFAFKRHSFSRNNTNTSQEIWWRAICLEMEYRWSHRPQSVCIITAWRPVPTRSSKWQRIAAYQQDQKSRKTCGSSFERVLDKRILVGRWDWNTQATH